MNDNQQPKYGIPYTMYVYDICRIEEVYNESDRVNIQLREGWIILFISLDYNGHVRYIMGQPRPKICEGRFAQKHAPTTKLWNHDNKEWDCPYCDPDIIEE